VSSPQEAIRLAGQGLFADTSDLRVLRPPEASQSLDGWLVVLFVQRGCGVSRYEVALAGKRLSLTRLCVAPYYAMLP